MRNGKIVLASGLALALSLTMTPAFSAPGRRSVARKVVVRPPVRRVVVVGSPWFGYWGPAFYPYGAYAPVPMVAGDRFPVELHVHPWKANLVIDGHDLGEARQFGSAGYPLWLEPGEHRIELSYPGYETLHTTIQTAPTLDQDFSFSLDEGEGPES